MDNERKELICKECGCNTFMIRKTRDKESLTYSKSGYRQYICIDCDAYDYKNTKWSDIEKRRLEIQSAKMERLELRIERLTAIKNRQQEYIDGIMMSKISSK
jgi:hypothetical protein